MHVNPAYLEAALNAGGTGYVLKSAAREELLEAIKSVMNGRIYVSPSLSSEHLERFKDPSRAAATLRLTVREREILQLIAEGRAAKEIAHRSEHLHQYGRLSSRKHQEKAGIAHYRRIDQARDRTRLSLIYRSVPLIANSQGWIYLELSLAIQKLERRYFGFLVSGRFSKNSLLLHVVLREPESRYSGVLRRLSSA